MATKLATRKRLQISPDLELPRDSVTSTFVVYGGKGMGKTTLGAVLCEELSAAGLRFSVIDPMGVFWGLRHARDGKGPGIEVLILGGRHGDIPIEPTGGAIVADLVADEDTDVVIDIKCRKDGTMWSLGERVRFVTNYCERLYQRQGERARPLMQIVDEAGRYCPQSFSAYNAPELAMCVAAIERMVEEGRNVGVGVTLITQRSARMNKSVSELADCMIAFRTVGPNSVGAVLDWFGAHVEKNRWKDLTEHLRKLERGTALVVSPGFLDFEGVAAIRDRTTFDSSATPKAGQERRAHGRGAQPDLAKYQARMAETIERAKSDDPRELKKQVAELRAQLAKVASRPALPPAPAAAAKVKVKEVAVVKDAQITRVDAAVKRAFAMVSKADEAAAKAGQAAKVVREELHVLVDQLGHAQRSPVVLSPPPAPPAALSPAPRRAPALDRVTKAFLHPDAPIAEGDRRMGRGEREVLVAMAQQGEAGITRKHLTVITGFTRRTRDSYLQRLLNAGRAAKGGAELVATPSGVADLGDYEALPTGSALLAHWLSERSDLGLGEKRALDEIAKVYPEMIWRGKLDTTLGYSRRTRDTYLQHLLARRLVEVASSGFVRLSPHLTDGGAS